MTKSKENRASATTAEDKFISDTNKKIFERIKKAMGEKKITQQDLANRCAAYGYNTNQSTISKLLNGSEKMDPCKLSVICKALDLNFDEILSLDLVVKSEHDDNGFITDANDKKFKGYLGEFHGYFFSTKDKETIHDGIFKFFKDEYSNNCKVSFRFSTGQTDDDGNPVYSEFLGMAKISDTLRAICCEMTAQDGSGDASYIIFKHDFLKNQKIECRFGMVVTICAGLKRLPVAHKILICKNKLSSEDYPFIKGQLRMNDNTFIVSAEKYEEFLNDPSFPDSCKHYVDPDNDRLKKKAEEQSFYLFTESGIKALCKKDTPLVLNLLRNYSDSKTCKKVGPKGEEFVIKYLDLKNKPTI